ncbi:MAG: Eco57I restriction-modification methylase domain-containing protein, partial [Thermomicrobiales bacterium]
MARGLTSVARHHAEWLALIEIAGPFLDLGILTGIFPQGLDGAAEDGSQRRRLQMLYEARLSTPKRSRPELETVWFSTVLREVLEWPESHIREGQAIPAGIEARLLEHGETLRPDLVLMDRERKQLLVLVSRFAPDQDLNKPVEGQRWAETPANRMVELLHQTQNTLGLVTNGESWMLVSAPAGQPSGFASWFANLWFEEHVTFVAFRALLGQRRFFGVTDEQTLPALLEQSRDAQTDVTIQLGGQVREAVELLVAGIDRADADKQGRLLLGIAEPVVYEAALTVMMRIIFLLYTEDQQPPLFGDNEIYDQNYSVSGLFARLREARTQDIEAVLEQREDAWSQLLAAFRLVYGGSAHDRMRLPAYGGSLFDPDRFPFLEGRIKGSDWREDPAEPLGINNREVLHMLEAVMLLEVKVGR